MFRVIVAITLLLLPSWAQAQNWLDHADSESVRWIQSLLSESGVDAGEIDGIDGPQTEQALAQFCASASVSCDDGTDIIVAALKIAAVQEALRGRGFDPGKTDGVLGPNTQAAIDAFCTNQGDACGRNIDALRILLRTPPSAEAQPPAAPPSPIVLAPPSPPPPRPSPPTSRPASQPPPSIPLPPPHVAAAIQTSVAPGPPTPLPVAPPSESSPGILVLLALAGMIGAFKLLTHRSGVSRKSKPATKSGGGEAPPPPSRVATTPASPPKSPDLAPVAHRSAMSPSPSATSNHGPTHQVANTTSRYDGWVCQVCHNTNDRLERLCKVCGNPFSVKR